MGGHLSCLGRRFERKANLLKHLLTHVEARPYVCHVAGCDQAFRQKWLLYRHGRVHQANKSKGARLFALLFTINHELVHSEAKYVSVYSEYYVIYLFFFSKKYFENCGRPFATARNLRLHQRIHTGDKPFVCEFPGCGMRYPYPTHLKRH